MSTQSNKSTSWFARLGSALGRKRRSASSGQNRRGLRFESLETRSLLSATVLPIDQRHRLPRPDRQRPDER